MSRRPSLRVLLYEPDPSASVRLAEHLRAQGHLVVRALDPRRLSGVREADAAVIALAANAEVGFALCRELSARMPVVLMGARLDAAACQRALRAGASDLVLLPVSTLELESALLRVCADRLAAPEGPQGFEHSGELDSAGIDQALRRLSGFALACGLGPSARTRMASAVAELLDNARQHAYPRGRGRVRLRARHGRNEFAVEVLDHGAGCDAAAALARSSARDAAGTPGGLARCRSLCEGLALHSTPNGTRVELVFELAPAAFAEDEATRLSERDWLMPEDSRRVLRDARVGGGAQSLSPAMALTIGRLLCAQGVATLGQSALWSR